MAAHPKHAVNGNGNGHGVGLTQKKLERLLAYHGGIADALRTTLGLLRGDAVEGRVSRAPDVLAQAVHLDAERRAQVAPARGPNSGAHTKAKLKRRKRTAALLARFDLHKPSSGEGTFRGLGVLIQHGFLKRSGGGYVRTEKKFTV